MSIRLEVAKAVCCADFISRHLILKIAEDCASISQFVLQFSNKLSSVDLIEHVIYGNAMKQIAISSRLDLSNEIVVSLIEHGNSEVINSLVSNSAAQITAHDFRQIYINFANEASLRELLCKRDDISADLRELIAFDVAKELEIFVINANWLNKKQAANAAKKSYEIAVIQISDRISGAEMADYIQKLSEEERLTPSIILRSITTGYMKFFEYALAYLAGVPIQKLHSLLHATNPLARQALFSRSKLPADLFPILTIAIDVYGTMNQKFANDSNQNKNDFSIKMIQNITESYHAQNHINQAYLQRVLDCYYIDISGKIAA
ncbi:MAG: DUF2336 domain-containing protein [Rhizobiales bacterium]|nr:DUF2336 domain-containing protein [Hyphomicrobiales bacterium]